MSICDCSVPTPDVFATVSNLSFIDIVGHNIGEPGPEHGSGHVVPAGVNRLRAGAPAGAQGMVFRNVTLSNTWNNVSWGVSGMFGPGPEQVSPPLILNGSGSGNQQAQLQVAAQCGDLNSTEQTLSSYWGSHHFMRFNRSQLGMPSLGWRVYSDHSLDLHHGKGLWLHLLRLGVGAQPAGLPSFDVEDVEYVWRPDFVEQSANAHHGLTIKRSRVYYTATDAIEADFEVAWQDQSGSGSGATLQLVGVPNPSYTYVTTHPIVSQRQTTSSVRLAVVLQTNLTHGHEGTAAGCIAAGTCTPLTVRAVVSVSVQGCGGLPVAECGNLTVRSVCASPPPPPIASQCQLTHQDSHAPCTLNETFGCYANETMWIANGKCRGEFSCSGVAGVSCPGTGSLIGSRIHCQCLPAPPTRSCNYTFEFIRSKALSSVSLHAAFEIVNASTLAALLDATDLNGDAAKRSAGAGGMRGVNQTTATINAWLAQAKALSTDNGMTARERVVYYRSWLNYWQRKNTSSLPQASFLDHFLASVVVVEVQMGWGNESGLPIISSSKAEYGRYNALWDTAFQSVL